MSAPGKILKGAAPLAPRRVPAAVHDAGRTARELVARAEGEARAVLASAEAAREARLAEATEEGRREGFARAAATLAAAALERDRLLASAGREVVALAVAIARKILGRELAARPEAVAELAASALAEVRARREVTLRVHPGDAPALRAAEGRLASLLLRAPLSVREDPAVAPGGAVVETEAGSVDASVETQLALLARALEEAMP